MREVRLRRRRARGRRPCAPSADLERLLGGAFVLEEGAQLAQARLGARKLVEIAAAHLLHRDLELVDGRGQVAAAEIRLGLRAMLRDGPAGRRARSRLQLVEAGS